jgi:hypothetical protein
MKKIIYSVVIALVLFSCGGNEEMLINELEELKQENVELKERIGNIEAKDSLLNEYAKFIFEIQNNLELIRQKESSLMLKSKNPEFNRTDSSIINDLQQLGALLADNKAKVNSMNARLKNSKLQIQELESVVLNLTSQVEERDRQILGMKGELSDLGVAFDELLYAYEENISVIAEKNQTIEAQEDMLNTAYYTFGTSKELKNNGVITKEGGFIGIGKTNKIKDDLNKEYFTEINIKETKEITLGVDKATLITSHPADSYKFVGENKVEKIKILNSEKFWSISRYLVVETK